MLASCLEERGSAEATINSSSDGMTSDGVLEGGGDGDGEGVGGFGGRSEVG